MAPTLILDYPLHEVVVDIAYTLAGKGDHLHLFWEVFPTEEAAQAFLASKKADARIVIISSEIG